MKPGCSFFPQTKSTSHLVVISVLLFLFPRCASAQAPPVPSSYQDLYTQLNNYLVNFNATLPPANGTPYPTLMTGSLKAANSNIGPQLAAGTSAMQYQLNALKAMGTQAIMVQVGFPVLYAPFLTSQGQSYTAFAAYYQAVATAVRQAGLKLIIENDTLLSNDVQAGWDVAPFYATLNWTQYQQARAQMALTVLQLMQPDYMVVLEEPATEAMNSGQSQANTPSGSASLLSQILATLQQPGVPSVRLGAGTATSEPNALAFVQQYVALPVDFIDFHIYPINGGFLPLALQIASTAAAAGKGVSMTECWLWKVRDSELSTLTDDQVRGRDPYSFWTPLDAYFIQTMQNMANYTQMWFMDPFGSEYFFAYLPYDDSTSSLTSAQILAEEESTVITANMSAQYTSTGTSYYNSNVTPADTIPPSAPTGLSGASANPTTITLSWNPAADNVGVAGYYVFRNGQKAGTTGTLYYQDSGLTEATTYTYTVEAFDLAGNISAETAPVNVQTSDTTPPSTPANVVAKAVACTKATVTWSASKDQTGVTQYLLFMGLSPNSLAQVASTGGSTTSYSNSTLSPATTYYFAVQAEDKYHNISYMSKAAAVTTPVLPVAPTGVSLSVPSVTKVTVTWSASTGGLPIAHYMVYRGTSPSSLSQIGVASGTSYNDLTVTPATKYYYGVQAADSGTPPAQSGISNPVPVTTLSPPSAPSNLAAKPVSCTKITLTWSPAASGGLPIANYRIYKGSSLASLAQLTITTMTSYTDANVLPQTMYYYAVQSADAGSPPSLSPVSPPVSVTTYGCPGAPGNFTATAVSSSKISLTWSPSASGGLPIASYHVYSGTSPGKLTQIAVTTATSYNNASLSPATTYYYAVQAADTAGDLSPLAGPVAATTFPLPAPPGNVSAQAKSSSQICLTWSPSSGALPIAHYFVLRGSTPTNMSQVAITTGTTYTDRSLSAGTTYYYGVQAADTAGDRSAISSPAAATTQP